MRKATTMLEQIHQHILAEQQQSSRTDTIFIVTAVVFNFIVLGVNSIVAQAATHSASGGADAVIVVFVLLNIVVNLFALFALHTGKQTRTRLLLGLVEMYRDHNVAKYYDPALLGNYSRRYLLFSGVILALALAAIAIPIIVRVM
jgi:hypothetical protein